MHANNINDVIHFLTKIMNEAKANQSPIGLFPALYRQVTFGIKERIDNNKFDDGERMDRLDALFANRYFDAYEEYRDGGNPSLCWEYAFKQTEKFWPVVGQHLILGINAHVNLDLGIAAARICPGDSIHSLKDDFNQINQLLADMVDHVEADLAKIWPMLRWILRISGRVDNFLIDFSMKTARDGAWKFATQLAYMSIEEQEKVIKERDKKVLELAKLIGNPGFITSSLLRLVRLGERGTVADKITILED